MSAAARTVWITGAASGMGAAHARRFAELGDWDVHADALEAVVEEIRAGGGKAEAVVADVTDPDAVGAAASRLLDALGPAAVVVANAGIILTGDHIEELELDAWRRVIDVNLTGAFLTSKAAIPQLRKAGDGALILVSSVCGLTASAGFGAYNASKHGVIGLMRTLANELGRDGVTVNAVCPGWVRTPMLGASIQEANADSESQRVRRHDLDRASDRAQGGDGCRRLPRLAGSAIDHRCGAAHRRRLDGEAGLALNESWLTIRSRSAVNP
jgi:NAD(P)-dependent dehydrogenase (short-subunit alcohol dehydrogenase family)